MDTMTKAAPQASVPLNAASRCDTDGSQAYTRWINSEGHDLLFCGHHTVKYEVKLSMDGFKMIQDEREKLHVKRESSAA